MSGNRAYLTAMREARDIQPAFIPFLDLELSPLTSTGFFFLFRTGLIKTIQEDKGQVLMKWFRNGEIENLPKIIMLFKSLLYIYTIQDDDEAAGFALSNGIADSERFSQNTEIVRQADILWKKLCQKFSTSKVREELFQKGRGIQLFQDCLSFINQNIADEQEQGKKK